MFCNNCGHRNPDDATFCSACGSVLDVDLPDDATATFAAVDSPDGDGDGDPSLSTEGSADPASTDPGSADPGSADTMAMVVVKRGPNAGSKYLLDADVTRAGRHPEADIFLDDITVSRRHAAIHRRGTVFVVTDEGSLNGTYVNRERIEEQALRNGDELQIGKFRLVFFTGSVGGQP